MREAESAGSLANDDVDMMLPASSQSPKRSSFTATMGLWGFFFGGGVGVKPRRKKKKKRETKAASFLLLDSRSGTNQPHPAGMGVLQIME